MISSTPFVARGQKLFFGWVTLSEHKWVTFGERRGPTSSGICCTGTSLTFTGRSTEYWKRRSGLMYCIPATAHGGGSRGPMSLRDAWKPYAKVKVKADYRIGHIDTMQNGASTETAPARIICDSHWLSSSRRPVPCASILMPKRSSASVTALM